MGRSRTQSARFALALHGGAGSGKSIRDPEDEALLDQSLATALQVGLEMLQRDASALDAVERVVRCLEDDPQFNAGRGAALDQQGGFQLDASIMDGRTLRCGAAAAVRTVRHPICLAKQIMLQTPHVLLADAGAEAFAEAAGLELVAADFFRVDRQVERWEQWRQDLQGRKTSSDGEMNGGTVGCVALDSAGHVAAATSTGGLVGKPVGRVGDSAIIGGGTYADNRAGAISCTGRGEHFMRRVVAYDVVARVLYQGVSLAEAAEQVVGEELEPGVGGLIAVDQQGHIAMPMNTPIMSRAAVDVDGRRWIGIGAELRELP